MDTKLLNYREKIGLVNDLNVWACILSDNAEM